MDRCRYMNIRGSKEYPLPLSPKHPASGNGGFRVRRHSCPLHSGLAQGCGLRAELWGVAGADTPRSSQ